MKSKIIGMSKYKCTGILFEMLVRQITSDTLSGIPESPALSILMKFFSPKMQLGKEIQLYKAFFEGRGLTEGKAIHFIDLILEQRRKLDERVLATEKYNLIKAIKESYDLKAFLSTKIPDYTLHASIYKTFLTEAQKDTDIDIVNIREVATARFTIIEHLTEKAKKTAIINTNAILEEYKNQTEEMRDLTYSLLVEKFDSKYANLNGKQKELIRQYINDVSSTHTLADYVSAEIPKLKKSMTELVKKVPDKVTQIKLNEVISQLNNIGTNKIIKDNEIQALMIAFELEKEIS